jgi:2'-5' RNA ligase
LSDSATLRAFIAVELPPALGDQLAALAARLRRAAPERAARWVRPEGIHLTLKFLGDVPVSQVEQIKALMEAATGDCGPFECAVAGLGCFPNLRQPRVVWVGVHDSSGALERLQGALEEGAARLGYPREPAGRGFNPHLTLARVGRETRGPEARQVGEAVQAAGPADLGRLPVEALALMQSDLRPGGAVYTRLHQARLGRAGA